MQIYQTVAGQKQWLQLLIFTIGCQPTTALKEKLTPYEKWYGQSPDLSHFRVFGYIAYAHIPGCQRSKLDKKAQKLRIQSKGYRLVEDGTSNVVI